MLAQSVMLVLLLIVFTLPNAPALVVNVSPTETCVVNEVPEPVTVGLAEVVDTVPVPELVDNANPISPVLINFFWSIDGTFIAVLELSTKLEIAYPPSFCKSRIGETFLLLVLIVALNVNVGVLISGVDDTVVWFSKLLTTFLFSKL